MADGPADANANSALTTWVTSALYVQLHTGPPGAAGTANQSSVTTRPSVTWGTAAGGVITASNQPTWTSWAGTNGEKVTDLSFWSQASGGAFQFSMAMQPPQAGVAPGAVMNTGDTLTLANLSVVIPEAA